MNVLIVGCNSKNLIAAIAAISSMEGVHVINVQLDEQHEAPPFDCTIFEVFREACKAAPPDTDWFLAELRDMRERIGEIIEWFAGHCRRVLRSFVTFNLPRRVIQQPCWSARRWKSLT